jgi:hypothetical protein
MSFYSGNFIFLVVSFQLDQVVVIQSPSSSIFGNHISASQDYQKYFAFQLADKQLNHQIYF